MPPFLPPSLPPSPWRLGSIQRREQSAYVGGGRAGGKRTRGSPGRQAAEQAARHAAAQLPLPLQAAALTSTRDGFGSLFLPMYGSPRQRGGPNEKVPTSFVVFALEASGGAGPLPILARVTQTGPS
jgi:hypothetical protein